MSIGGFGQSSGFLLSAQGVGSASAVATSNLKPVGTGPYRFVGLAANSQMDLEAWSPHFYFGVPRYKVAQLVVIPEGTTRVAALRTGSGEGAVIEGKDIASLRASYDIVTGGSLAITTATITDQFVTEYPGYGKNPTSDPRVRQALQIAVDRDLLNNSINYGVGTPTGTKQDLAKAKQLLTEAGWPDGFQMKTWAFGVQGVGQGIEIMEAMAVWGESIGIKVKRQGALDVVAFYNNFIAKHNFDMPGVAGTAPTFVQGFAVGIPGGGSRPASFASPRILTSIRA